MAARIFSNVAKLWIFVGAQDSEHAALVRCHSLRPMPFPPEGMASDGAWVHWKMEMPMESRWNLSVSKRVCEKLIFAQTWPQKRDNPGAWNRVRREARRPILGRLCVAAYLRPNLRNNWFLTHQSSRLYSTSFVKTSALGGLPLSGTAVLTDLLIDFFDFWSTKRQCPKLRKSKPSKHPC